MNKMFYPFNSSQCLLALLSGHVTSHKNCYFVNDFIISHLSFITYHDTSSRCILIKPDFYLCLCTSTISCVTANFYSMRVSGSFRLSPLVKLLVLRYFYYSWIGSTFELAHAYCSTACRESHSLYM